MADQAIYAPMRVLDADGEPVPGALVYFYATGTTTLIDVYLDAAATILSTNPVVADANGFLPQRFVTGAVKAVLTRSTGETLYTIDPVPTAFGLIGAASSVSFAPTPEIPSTDVQSAIVVVDSEARVREALIQADIEDLQDDFATLGPLATKPTTGTPSASNFLRGDGEWTAVPDADAIARGDAGQQRVQPRALATYAGRADLTPAASPTPVAFTNLDASAVLLVDCYARTTSSGANLTFQVSASNDGGSTWSGWSTVDLIAGETGVTSGTLQVNLKAGTAVGGTLATGAIDFGVTGLNAVRFRALTSGAGTPSAKVLLHYIGEAP